MERRRIEKEKDDALMIAYVLRVAIPLAKELGWSSDRTYREAELASARWNGAPHSSGGRAAEWPTASSRMASVSR